MIMKITTEKYPILKVIEDNVGFRTFNNEQSVLLRGNHIIDEFLNIRKKLPTKTMFLSKPFSDAFEQAKQRIWDTIRNGDVKEERFCNAYITPIMGQSNTMVYDVSINKGSLSGMFYKFMDDVLIAYCVGEDYWVSDRFFNAQPYHTDRWQFIMQCFIEIASFEVFLKYAEIETKHLPPKSKVKDGKKQHKNETNSTVTILDSTWFTTLVKSDAFKVRGHFRLQPYGEGRKERKLIWINDFQKSGYTAPARKLNNND